MPEQFTVGELGMRAARGDALRVVARQYREFNEIIGEVTGHHESERCEKLTVWVSVGSIRKWRAGERQNASPADWYRHEPERWGEVGIDSGTVSEYQVHIDSEECGETWAVPLGWVEELETGSVVTHSVPGEERPRQTELTEFCGGCNGGVVYE